MFIDDVTFSDLSDYVSAKLKAIPGTSQVWLALLYWLEGDNTALLSREYEKHRKSLRVGLVMIRIVILNFELAGSR